MQLNALPCLKTSGGHGGMAPHRLRKSIGRIVITGHGEKRVALRRYQAVVCYFHFSRRQTGMGMSPTNYIAERRIEHATKLMQETDLPISEIALRAGFSSQSHFTTSFRRLARVTPRSYRKGI